MTLVWKLLRKHISIGQFAGFFFANLFGMLIVLFGYQFYNDVLPVFVQGDSFMKSDYLIVSKKIGTATALSGSSSGFSNAECDDLAGQPFCSKVGRFTSTEYKATATMGVQGQTILNTELFFESVPDDFVDVPQSFWKYEDGSKDVPVIIPRTYINMYNFGYAQSHSLPKISDGLASMVDVVIRIQANGRQDEFRGHVVAFSNRLSSVLVPQAFMDWSNQQYAPNSKAEPNRLMVEIANPTDNHVTQYLEQHGYEVDSDKLDSQKTAYFLKLVVAIVMVIGLVISVLSFYILMLSIYLLVQKNTGKLENLLLIGYSPAQVAAPYQWLTVALNAAVLVIALVALTLIRSVYMDILISVYPSISTGGILPTALLGCGLFALVTLLNYIVIRRKIMLIWKHKE